MCSWRTLCMCVDLWNACRGFIGVNEGPQYRQCLSSVLCGSVCSFGDVQLTYYSQNNVFAHRKLLVS